MADEDLSNTEQSSSIPSGDALASPDVPASSSDADQGESKESLLEAVQKAVPELRQDADDPSIDPGASPAQAAKDASVDESELPDAVTQEELAKYSKAAQKRISKLNKQRQKLTGEVQRLKEIEPSAQAAEQVTGYLRNNDISREDFLMGLELMSAMRRGDFRTFYEGVKPYMRLAEEYLGHALPPDLQAQVNQGHMTTQAAQMYSKERMDRAMAQTNVQREQQRLASYPAGDAADPSPATAAIFGEFRTRHRQSLGSRDHADRSRLRGEETRCAGHDVGCRQGTGSADFARSRHRYRQRGVSTRERAL